MCKEKEAKAVNMRKTLEMAYWCQVRGCKQLKTCEGFIFAKLYEKFLEIKSLQNGEITLLFTNVGKSCP